MIKKLPISLIVAAKNCEDRIEGTLSPFASLVSEMIVVDDESTDRTAEKAKALGAKVWVQKAPDGNFDRNRKAGMELASAPWILYFDTDERPTRELLNELEQFFENPSAHEGIDGVRIPNAFYFLGTELKHGIYNPNSAEIRLFRKGAFEYPCEAGFHRGILIKGKVVSFQHAYRHFNVNTLSEWFIKTNQYTEVDAAQSSEMPKTAKAIVWRACRFFFRHYVIKQGFRDGVPGFLSVFYFTLYHFTLQFKIWEKHALQSKALEAEYLHPISIPKR